MFGRAALRAARLVDQDAALPDDRRRDRETEQPDKDQGAPPSEKQHQRSRRRRCRGKPDIAGKGVKGKGASEPRRVDRAAQDRVIRRMKDRVANPRKQRQKNELPVGAGKSHRRHRQGHQQSAADQERARPVAVDEKPHRRLHDCRGPRHHRHHQAEPRE